MVSSRWRGLASTVVVVGLLAAACGGGGGSAEPTGSFDGVDGPGAAGDEPEPAAEVTDSVEDAATPDEDTGQDGAAVSGAGDDGDDEVERSPRDDGAEGAPPDPDEGGDGAVGDDAGAVALATWDEFLDRWAGLRNGDVTRAAVAEVAVFDEAVTQVVDASLEGDESRATTSVELFGGTRSEITVAGLTVTFVDCVYEKALGSVPWVLAQRWDVTVGLDAGPGGAPAVTRLTQRATVEADGEVVYDVCLNPVLEAEVVAAHEALREMFVETQEDPVAGIEDPRIDGLLMPSNAVEFREQLQTRIDEGTRLVNGLGTDLRVQVFAHGPNFVGTISCEDQLAGYERVDEQGKTVWGADESLESFSVYRLVRSPSNWRAEMTRPGDDFSCPGQPLDAVEVEAGPRGVPQP